VFKWMAHVSYQGALKTSFIRILRWLQDVLLFHWHQRLKMPLDGSTDGSTTRQQMRDDFLILTFINYALCGLVVSVLATGPMGLVAAGSGPTEDRGFLWVIKIPSTEVKPSVPCRRFTACKRTLHSMSEMLCPPNFLTCFSPLIFSCFATRWLWLNQADSKRCCGSRLATCSSNTLNRAMEPY
jgi:hypothetical protein